MQIHYFGLSSFKIITKNATVITDPFDKESGLTPPRGNADILVLAEKNNPLYNTHSGISADPFLINDPGEYDLKGVTVTGIPLLQDEGRYVTIFLMESEGVKILNLTHIREFNISEKDLDSLGDIDILIVPVGGNSVMTAKEARKAVNQIEPKVVIPSHYDTKGMKLKYDNQDDFYKELGVKPQVEEKLIVKKKEFPEENYDLIELTPLR